MMWITAWINYPTLFRCIIHYSTIFVLSCCGAAHRTAILYCIFRYPTDNCHCTQDRHAVEVSLAHRLYTYVMIMHIFFFPWRHANVYHFSARPSYYSERHRKKLCWNCKLCGDLVIALVIFYCFFVSTLHLIIFHHAIWFSIFQPIRFLGIRIIFISFYLWYCFQTFFVRLQTFAIHRNDHINDDYVVFIKFWSWISNSAPQH